MKENDSVLALLMAANAGGGGSGGEPAEFVITATWDGDKTIENVSKTFDEILDAFENHKNPVLYCSNINGFINVYLRMSAENVMRSAFGATPTESIAFSSSYENKIFRASCLNGTWSMATFEMTAS